MGTILDTIADYAKARVERDKERVSLDAVKEMCSSLSADRYGDAFVLALKKPEISFICEVKKASPSKGIIANNFPYVHIAKEYESAGADCISCLTEPKWFLGSDEIFCEIRKNVTVPMLRKDFTVDEYQLYQAKLMGANAVLLICAILDNAKLEKYLAICEKLGLAAIVEAHDENEIKNAVSVGAKIIGVNNRNLKDFSVDINNSGRLRDLVPDNILFVAESGIRTPDDVRALKESGANAVLIGETLMRAEDKSAMLEALRSGK